jgi:hypothetical protein
MNRKASARRKKRRLNRNISAIIQRPSRKLGFYQPESDPDLCFVVEEPFGEREQVFLIGSRENGIWMWDISMGHLRPTGFHQLDRTGMRFNSEVIQAAFERGLERYRGILKLGSDAYPTVAYIEAGGQRRKAPQPLDKIDAAILAHWSGWQNRGLPMKERVVELERVIRVPISAGMLTTRITRLHLRPDIRQSKQKSVR